MDDWKPELNRAAPLATLPLSAEEGFVLSRLDGRTTVRDLCLLTGFAPARVNAILGNLVTHGAVTQPTEAASAPVVQSPTLPPAEARDPLATEALEPEPAELEEGTSDDADGQVTEGLQQRALFESALRQLPADQRIARASLATEPELSAFCFDPLPAVIKAVLENAHAGLTQARLIARHHRNPVGLEAVSARAAFAADVGVRRWLMRNPQLPTSVLRRLCTSLRMLALHKLQVDRDVPEQSRRTARELLRARFGHGAAEERVELIFKTEGRALNQLSGLPIDGKTTALLCGRSYGSTLFIQNLARWSAAPPQLIAHLLRQDLVKRQPQLRLMLVRHPNAPPELKRGG